MKKLIYLFISGTMIIGLSTQCHKKDSDNTTPATSSTPTAQATINGTTFKATSQLTVPNDSALTDTNSTFNPIISSNGSFVNYTFTKNSDAPFVHQYFLAQGNIVAAGDTLFYFINLASINPLTTGTAYKLYGPNNTPTTLATLGTAFGVAEYQRTTQNFNDSTATGTLTFSTLDMTNKVASGTFQFTTHGTKGSTPDSVQVTNGQFSNLPLQEF